MPDLLQRTRLAGVVLAAGAGERAGGPKALRRRSDGEPWIHVAVRTLRDGGCDDVVVVLGAGATLARQLVPADVVTVVTERWRQGQSASLSVGLDACADLGAGAAVVTLVDLPEQRDDAVRRVVDGAATSSLRRATFGGRPGHPVLIGRDHWGSLAGRLAGDAGARAYLRQHRAAEVDCTDLGGGEDVDLPPGH